ncbi:hypothetical protein J6I39_06560 [bacterium]|nr:hypothetical protein [bacterium]
MNKFAWKIEYSLTIFAIFAGILFMIPTSFSSKTAVFISRWNSEFNKIQYAFSALSAQTDSEGVKNIKNSKNPKEREKYMIKLIKPYLRLEERFETKKYIPHFMNGKVVPKDDLYYFSLLYTNQDDMIVGVKDIADEIPDAPVYMLMIDTNGSKKPNIWGKDIFGLNIYIDGNVNPFGYGWDVDKLRKDCSNKGTGTSCSHFYRIGGEFVE